MAEGGKGITFLGDRDYSIQKNLDCYYNSDGYDQYAMSLMAEDYNYFSECGEDYVTRGMVLKCSRGTCMTRIDALKDHGVYNEAGEPVLLISDSTVGDNIYSFGACKSSDGILRPCIPNISGNWKQAETDTMVKSSKSKKFDSILLKSSVIVCQNDALISLPDQVRSSYWRETPKDDYFIISGSENGLTVRTEPGGSENIEPQLQYADTIKIVLSNNAPVIKTVNNEEWIAIKHQGETGYIPKKFALRDEVITTLFPNSDFTKITGKVDNAVVTLEPLKKWAMKPPKGKAGAYNGKPAKDSEGRYFIALGPRLLNPNIPDDHLLTTERLNAYSRYVKITLIHKDDENEDDPIVVDCFLKDIKVHTYHKFPSKNGITSKDINSASYPELVKGLVQTGIRYPEAANKLVYAKDNVDGSIVEFCTDGDLDFEPNDYILANIITNFDISDRKTKYTNEMLVNM